MSVFRHPAAAAAASRSRNWYGDGSDGDVVIAADTQLDSLQDGDMVVRNYNNLTVSAGATLTTAHRCRGLLIYVDGLLQLDGTISMTARGCRANPADAGTSAHTPVAPSDGRPVAAGGIRFVRFAPGARVSGTSDLSGCGLAAVAAEENQPAVDGNGICIDIPPAGGSGGPAQAGAILDGAAGQTLPGGSGGGGSGASSTGASGAGSAGTCFSGGCGGGGNGRGVGTVAAVNAAPYGGKGGDGYDGTEDSGGGAGNPGGRSYLSRPERAGQDGTGGLLIIIARRIAGTGRLESCGMNGGSANDKGGGGSGGGIVLLLSAGFTAWQGSADVSGGVGGDGLDTRAGDGGSGSVIQHSIY